MKEKHLMQAYLDKQVEDILNKALDELFPKNQYDRFHSSLRGYTLSLPGLGHIGIDVTKGVQIDGRFIHSSDKEAQLFFKDKKVTIKGVDFYKAFRATIKGMVLQSLKEQHTKAIMSEFFRIIKERQND